MSLALPEFLAGHPPSPVAIFGRGVSGEGVRSLLDAAGVTSRLYDAADEPFTVAAAAAHRVVVYSPGFPPGHPWLAIARLAGADCWSELDFASLFWKGRIVAVTGTNGKTTLTEFLVHALTASGRAACAVGNIGRAFSQTAAERDGGAPEEIAVCEVSSFQAETLRHFWADATLWTNFAEDHLERHGGLADYFAAKAALAVRSGAVLAGSSVRRFAPALGRGELDAKTTWVETLALPDDPELADTVFAAPPQRENFVLAAAWWLRSGFSSAPLYAAARTFRLGRHRLARVGEAAGVVFWNDSKATNFHAVEGALERFAQPVLLLAGGKSKGGDIAAFVLRIAPRVRELFLIGDTADAMAAGAAAAGVPFRRCLNLRDATAAAAAAARPGDHVLLSPGFASFDQFRNYQDRGDQFEAAVRELASAPPVPC